MSRASRASDAAGSCTGSSSCSGLVVAQGALGYYQYFNGVPRLAVGFHVAGATAVFSATVVVLLSMYEPVRARPGLDGDDGTEREAGASPDPVAAPAGPPAQPEAGVTGALLPGQ